MDNSRSARETVSAESSEVKSTLRRNQKPIWFAPQGFLLLALSLSSIFGFVRKFPEDLFIANWLAWLIAGFFATGWLLSHWLEFVVFRKQKRNAVFLLLFTMMGSLFFCFYFELLIDHQVLKHFGLASAYLVVSGFSLRLALFHEESFKYLLQQRQHLLKKLGISSA
jgi:hypothetical protein